MSTKWHHVGQNIGRPIGWLVVIMMAPICLLNLFGGRPLTPTPAFISCSLLAAPFLAVMLFRMQDVLDIDDAGTLTVRRRRWLLPDGRYSYTAADVAAFDINQYNDEGSVDWFAARVTMKDRRRFTISPQLISRPEAVDSAQALWAALGRTDALMLTI